ncbi:hypothetical protein EL22_02470 [Halostagnicola sp. A56]|uniref:hypothetical protein n=1 Tax=Halostagnicola sp. A56 TaxID=1495067 RepID=UPI00049FC98C|nr:hypothetical protein [Halostagnicola sp. A56]KDE58796.1 hypothetical protein EL22_02470 [Halostagnicola sp. A56]
MVDRNLVLIAVAATVFVGLLLGWVTGVLPAGSNGSTEIFGIAMGAFIVVVALAFVWFIVTSFGRPD